MITNPNVSREVLSRALAFAPLHYKPIVKAIRDYDCGHATVLQDAGPFKLPLHTKPAIIVIGDDLQTAKGPAAFDAVSMLRVIRQCESCFVIASAAVETTYASACFAPVQLRKHVMIIETLPAHEKAWVDFVTEGNPDISMVISKVDPTARPEPQTWGRA